MSRQGLEFSFWALMILAGATALIMYQHAQHSASIVGAITGAAGIPGVGVQTTPAKQASASGQQPPVPFGFFDFEGDPGYY